MSLPSVRAGKNLVYAFVPTILDTLALALPLAVAIIWICIQTTPSV